MPGTFLLVFTVGCNVLGGSAVWGGVSIASVLMVAVYALGGISGACLNPAVSLALGMAKALGAEGHNWTLVTMYSSVQLVAGVVAALSSSVLFGRSAMVGPTEGFGWLNAGLCEMVYTPLSGV